MNFSAILAAIAKFKTIAMTVLALIPVIEQAIAAAEAAIGPGNGANKLQFVLDFLKTGYASIQGVEATFEEVLPMLTTTISSLVAAWKAIGHDFSGGATPTAAPVKTT